MPKQKVKQNGGARENAKKPAKRAKLSSTEQPVSDDEDKMTDAKSVGDVMTLDFEGTPIYDDDQAALAPLVKQVLPDLEERGAVCDTIASFCSTHGCGVAARPYNEEDVSDSESDDMNDNASEDDDEHIMALAATIPLDKNSEAMKSLLDYFCETAGAENRAKLRGLVAEGKLGWLMYDAVCNCPMELTRKCLTLAVEELQTTEALKRLTRFVLVVRAFRKRDGGTVYANESDQLWEKESLAMWEKELPDIETADVFRMKLVKEHERNQTTAAENQKNEESSCSDESSSDDDDDEGGSEAMKMRVNRVFLLSKANLKAFLD